MNLDEYVAKSPANEPASHAASEGPPTRRGYRHALLDARLEAGLTQKQLAERAGMKQSVIARLEAGGRTPTLETMRRLAAALNLDFVVTATGAVETRQRDAV